MEVFHTPLLICVNKFQTLSIPPLAGCEHKPVEWRDSFISLLHVFKTIRSSISFLKMNLWESHLAFYNMYLFLASLIPVNTRYIKTNRFEMKCLSRNNLSFDQTFVQET